MTGIREAAAAVEAAKEKAKQIVAEAQIQLGREILAARATGTVQQKDIAEELEITREQVRRLEVAAEKAGMTIPGGRPRGRRRRRTVAPTEES